MRSEVQKVCLYQLMRPGSPMDDPNVGDCTKCLPDEERNCECALYTAVLYYPKKKDKETQN